MKEIFTTNSKEVFELALRICHAWHFQFEAGSGKVNGAPGYYVRAEEAHLNLLNAIVDRVMAQAYFESEHQVKATGEQLEILKLVAETAFVPFLELHSRESDEISTLVFETENDLEVVLEQSYLLSSLFEQMGVN